MEKKYQNILIAVDGSGQADAAFEEACATAQLNGAKLAILYVIENVGTYWGEIGITPSSSVDRMQEIAEDKLGEYYGRAKEKGISEVTTFVLYGSPKAVIVNFDEAPIDLIVVGKTGLNAVERVLVGSTTSYVVTHAKCNVLVVN